MLGKDCHHILHYCDVDVHVDHLCCAFCYAAYAVFTSVCTGKTRERTSVIEGKHDTVLEIFT